MTGYEHIEKAIGYIYKNFSDQPSLEDIAEHVQLSPFYFQKIFQEWAGVSPKKFLQYISLQHAKKCLSQKSSLLETTLNTGLSSVSRLHDLFINVEGMTPAEYKNQGASLTIHYQYSPTVFGDILIASTPKGICHLSFVNNKELSLQNLKSGFCNAQFIHQTDDLQQNALAGFPRQNQSLRQIKLHLKGTPFQLKVWQALLEIPQGQLESYANIAKTIQMPTAQRAVGSAIGKNPIAYLIPCHRVIQSTGLFGNYLWGIDKKISLIGWDACQTCAPEEGGE